ncbi:MAG: membrane protein insertase YidC [Sideroxydans sp.]|nr:membrane protein insertase YidC [Sideroxydans sp.]
MDTQRLFLFLIFSFSLVMVWDGWQRFQHPQAVLDTVENKTKQAAPVGTVNNGAAAITAQAAVATGKLIKIKTDLLDVSINTVGGDIEHLAFLQHPEATDKNLPFVLFAKGQGTHNYLAQTGLLGGDLPTHNSVFTAEKDNYTLQDNAESVAVLLTAITPSGITVSKTLTFHKASYLIDVAYQIDNHSAAPVTTSAYFQLLRDGEEPAGGTKFVPTYTGSAVYTDKEKLIKADFSSIEKGKTDFVKEANNGWIGVLQHYFVAAWLPKDQVNREYFTRKLDNGLYATGTVLAMPTVAPNTTSSLGITLYVGPAQSSLDTIAPGLGLSVDYGWLTIVAKPMFWMMTWLNGLVHNWGVAIILLTVLIKLLFFPLSAASYRSMAKMRVVAPKLEKIKLQYSDDREKLNRAMMDLYKTEKINPLGGCLPVLIQIPVFIALYWSILESVEMRYAPFFGWITDLSVADPYYILPIIMGASMILQSKLNPVPPDPMQAKLMQIMPVIFSVVFFFFPAGLVLYSVVNNVLSIAQQWYITKKLENDSGAVKA